MQRNNTLHEAISEISVLTNMYKQTINPRLVGDFLAHLSVGNKPAAKSLWNTRVRDRVYCCGMESILVEEIDDFLS